MADIFSKQKRSEIMARIRAHGNKPEERLYEIVRASLGHRWRIERNVESMPGRPDVVIPSLRLVIFVDGCFFHMCPHHGRVPDSNKAYWEPKLLRNVARDRDNRERLRNMGFSVWTLWEHDLRGAHFVRSWRVLSRALLRRVSQLRR